MFSKGVDKEGQNLQEGEEFLHQIFFETLIIFSLVGAVIFRWGSQGGRSCAGARGHSGRGGHIMKNTKLRNKP